MSNEIKEVKDVKNSFLDAEMTRRHFLKVSGKTIAGLTLSASMLSLLGVTQAQVARGDVLLLAQEGGLLVVNRDRCFGCRRCEAICTLVKDGRVGAASARLQVTRTLMYSENDERGMYTDLRTGWACYPDMCRQCRPAPCEEICPIPAAFYWENGVLFINEDACVGCTQCVRACPWGVMVWNAETRRPAKCDNCGECVKRCPTGCLSIVPWDAVLAAAQS